MSMRSKLRCPQVPVGLFPPAPVLDFPRRVVEHAKFAGALDGPGFEPNPLAHALSCSASRAMEPQPPPPNTARRAQARHTPSTQRVDRRAGAHSCETNRRWCSKFPVGIARLHVKVDQPWRRRRYSAVRRSGRGGGQTQ